LELPFYQLFAVWGTSEAQLNLCKAALTALRR
jgi:hypothetical protein